MKENQYDDGDFFARYSDMPRSIGGLAAAGEWHELRKLLPDFNGRKVLDLGCGFGWHCLYALEHGAAGVVGVDLSANMLRVAREKSAQAAVEYLCCGIEDYDYPAETFDVVLSSLALHYVESLEAVFAGIHRTLKKGGELVFSIEHPVFTAQGPQQWCCGPDGCKLHWPVDRYFEEGERRAEFLGVPVVKYHHTLNSCLGGLLRQGFEITGVVEPAPEAGLLDTVPEMRDELRRPMMLIAAARKR